MREFTHDFYYLNSKLCTMGKFIAGNNVFIKRIFLRIQLILLAMLPAFGAIGQGNSNEQDNAVPARDKLLMEQYSKASSNGSISPDTALKILSKELVLAKKYNIRKKIGHLWMLMAARNLQKREMPAAGFYLDSAFKLNDQLKDPELTVQINDMAAWYYKRQSNYAKAVSCYFRAVQTIEENKIENERPVAKLYSNLGVFMFEQNESSLAKKYLLLGRQHVLRTQPIDSAQLINIYVMLGMSQFDTDSAASAGYFREAYAMADKCTGALSYVLLVNLCMGYLQIHQYATSEHFLDLAKAATPPGESLVMIETLAGSLDCKNKKYATAEKHLLNALELTHNENDNMREQIYEMLAALYEARGEYRKAFIYDEKYMEQYKMHKGDTKKTVTDFMLSIQALEHEKTILQKQAEISAREAAIKKQRFWIATMCLVSVLLCVILVMAYRNYRNKKALLSQQMRALLQDQEIERLKAEAEGADNERSRIAYDIHDGVLVRLANVKMNLAGLPSILPEFAGSKRYQGVVEQLDIATRELRNTAHNLMPEMLLAEGLAQAIFYFCKATEQASGLNIKFQQVGSSFPRLQPQVETAVYRIVQGLIQNVIQHARATTTLVQLQYADHLCSITIEDNGNGVTDIQNKEGYGIKSIRNRIKILRGTLDIDSQVGHGTTIYLEFDVRPFLQNTPVNN